jgi:hypothetical protein
MFLSRRRLVFTGSQVYFQCACTCRLEAFNVDWLDYEEKSRARWIWKQFYAFPPHLRYSGSSLLARIKEYYLRQLSFDKDVLNALGGIFNAYISRGANTFEFDGATESGDVRTCVDNHFYGIPVFGAKSFSTGSWHNTFAPGLSWSTFSSSQSTRRSGWPSWSWASVKGGSIQFMGYANETNIVEIVLSRRRSGATIRLRDFAVHKLDYTDFEPWFHIATQTLRLTQDYLDEVQSLGYVAWDPDYEPEEPPDLTAVLLTRKTMAGFAGVMGVSLLVKLVGRGSYKRVGLLTIYQEALLGDESMWTRETIRLI